MNQKQQKRVREEGYRQGVEHTTYTVFAAVTMAAHREFGFGSGRCARLLNSTYHIMLEQLSSKEALNAAWDEVGLRMNFENIVDPVEATDK